MNFSPICKRQVALALHFCMRTCHITKFCYICLFSFYFQFLGLIEICQNAMRFLHLDKDCKLRFSVQFLQVQKVGRQFFYLHQNTMFQVSFPWFNFIKNKNFCQMHVFVVIFHWFYRIFATKKAHLILCFYLLKDFVFSNFLSLIKQLWNLTFNNYF